MRDIYPANVKPGMIFRWHPTHFPKNRPPRWLQATEVDTVSGKRWGQVWIAYQYENDREDCGVSASGRWFYDVTLLQSAE